jgi:hypothetical protein
VRVCLSVCRSVCLSVCRSALKNIHIVRHIRCPPGDSWNICLRPAGCIWIPVGIIWMTVRPIMLHSPHCDSRNISMRPAGCIWIPLASILVTRETYFETRGFHLDGFLELRARPVEPVGHLNSLSGKRCEKGSTWRSHSSSEIIYFRYTLCNIFFLCNIFTTLWVVARELNADWLPCNLFATFCRISETEEDAFYLSFYSVKRMSHISEQNPIF